MDATPEIVVLVCAPRAGIDGPKAAVTKPNAE